MGRIQHVLPWDAQPQEACGVSDALSPVIGINAANGFVGTRGELFTTGTGLSRLVGGQGVEIDSAQTGLLKRDAAFPAGHPYTFVGVARQDDIGTQCIASLATTGDKTVRVYANNGSVFAQHIGSITYAAATTGNVYYYNTQFFIVAAFDSPTSVRVWARGRASDTHSFAQNTTNVGTLDAPTRAAFLGYSGSVDTAFIDGGITFGQWLRYSPTEQQALAWLYNPWSLFEPRRIWVPVSAGGGVADTSFTASSATTPQASATLATAITAAASSSTAPAASATLATSISLAATSSTAPTATAALGTSINLSAAASSASATAAALGTAIPLQAAASTAPSTTATLTAPGAGMQVAASSAPSCLASLGTAIPLQAAASTAPSTTATLTAPGSSLQVQASAAPAVSASLGTSIRLAAVASTSPAVTAQLTATAAAWSVLAIAQAQVSAALSTGIRLQASPSTRPAVMADLDTGSLFTAPGRQRIGTRLQAPASQRVGTATATVTGRRIGPPVH